MRLSGSRAYYRPSPPKMPSGLVELIEGLTREVLKHNPTDIYGFSASYVQQLLEIRDGPLQKKSLTLEEKIARAQQKVRERTEKRKQKNRIDSHTQQSDKGTEVNAISHKVSSPSPFQQTSTVVSTHNTPIDHEQELVNSSEVEISHATQCNTESEDLQSENKNNGSNIDNEPTKDNDNNNTNTNVVVTKCDPYNETPNLGDDDNAITEDIDLNKQLKAQNDHEDSSLSSNEKLPEKATVTQIDEGIADEQITQHMSVKEQNSTSLPDSMTVNQNCVVIDSGETMIIDHKQAGSVTLTHMDKHDTNLQLDSLITNVVESQSDVLHQPNYKEETLIEPANDTQLAQKFSENVELNIDNIDDANNIMINDTVIEPANNSQLAQKFSENVELNIDNIDDVNNIMINDTIDISFKESPTVEQDPLNNSDALESLIEINTDGDVLTLLTQESHNDDLNFVESDKIIKNETELTINELQLNPINTVDIDGNPDNVVDNDTTKSSHCENDTLTHSTETPQISQDTNNMDLETAAITIQKVFRTFLFKSRASTFDEAVSDETIFLNEAEKSKEDCNFANSGSLNERRSHGITRMDTVLQTVNEEKSLSLSTDDSSTLSSAATVIQAHVRGFLVRNKLNANKTLSTNSLAASHSNEPSLTSLEMDNDQNKNKTVLNIHIVPDNGNFLSRDESLITSMDLSLDSSPPSSINLHPLGYDKSERRKQLKREDAIQSISPPSDNSGKLSVDVDSVKELPLNDQDQAQVEHSVKVISQEGINVENIETPNAEQNTSETIVNSNVSVDFKQVTDNEELIIQPKRGSLSKVSSDEMDVVTPSMPNDSNCSDVLLVHSGEFHDAVLPTKVTRGDTSVASGE